MSDKIRKEIEIGVDSNEAENALNQLENKLDGVSTGNTKVTQSTKELGIANRNTAKAVGENGGAIAILDTLTGGMATQFKDAAEATKLFNFSLGGVKTALIATGIGALVVSLGLIIVYWDQISDAITGANKSLENQISLNRINSDLIGSELSLMDKQIELFKTQGKATTELQKQRRALIEAAKELEEVEVKLLERQLKRLEGTEIELGFWEQIKVAAITAFLGVGEGAKAAAASSIEAIQERKQAVLDLKKEIDEAKISAINFEIQLFNIDNPKSTKKDDKEEKAKKNVYEKLQLPDPSEAASALEELGRIRKEYFDKNRENDEIDRLTQIDLDRTRALEEIDELVLNEELKRQAIAEVNKFYDDESLDAEKELSEAKKELGRRELDAKLKNADLIAGGLATLSELAGKETAAGKALAVASTTIDTIRGGVSAFTGMVESIPGPVGIALGAVAAAGVVASGFASVKKILSVKVPNSGGGGGGSPSIGAPTPPPQFNLVGSSGKNQLAESINRKQNDPVRAYVLSDEVTTAQSLDRNRINNSTFL